MSIAKNERRAIVETMRTVGADAPTLCEGWTVLDLAAHLVVRERRPDAVIGAFVSQFADRNERTLEEYKAKGLTELVSLIEAGPQKLNPWRLVDDQANAAEFFVHHEDILRAQPQWQARSFPPGETRELWKAACRFAKMALRKSPLTIVLRRTDGVSATPVEVEHADVVTIVGEAGEVLLWVMGRDEATVEFEGSADAVEKVKGLTRSL